jgi:cholest-4-en-3-one 26-monooxygenase
MTMDLETLDIHRPSRYGRGYPWKEWDFLRKNAPVFWYERHDIEPFWAITTHKDIMTVSGLPDIFINGGPRLRLALRGETEVLRDGVDEFGKERGWDPQEPPDLTFMDNPRHRHVRKLSSWAYTQSSMREITSHFQELAQSFTKELHTKLNEDKRKQRSTDFVGHLACKLPLAATGELMGLAPEDWKKILVWSNAIIGEVEQEDLLPDETVAEASSRNMYDFRSYLEELVRESRENGAKRGGLIDRMVHTEVQGKFLNDQQLIGYLFVLIAAGNDTTRNATAGGVAALLEHPQQLKLLCENPELLPKAVEEILRWTSPVVNFLRTCTRDYNLSGTTIKEGDTVGVFYPSANRDEAIFDNPYEFDISREHNPHITFGFGAHFCLGTNVARAELKASIEALLPLLPQLELAEEGSRISHAHVTGFSKLPVRLKQNH